jgi:periplasmic protein TonB
MAAVTTTLPELPDDSLGQTSERFGFTLFMSLCVHAILILGVGFTVAMQPRTSTSLDITLASFLSDTAPDVPDFLAQANQQGSGTEDAVLAPATDVLARFSDQIIREVVEVLPPPPVLEPMQQDNIIARQNDVAANTGEPVDNVVTPDIPSDPAPPVPEPVTDNLASLQAQLDLHRQAYANRPRRYTMTSASTKQDVDALYLDNWRKRIEAIGNLNYPSQASTDGIYGTLRLMVSLSPDGTVNDIRILRSSGEKVLDDAAIRIVQLASPFDPFPPELRARVDILEIIRTWQFHRGNTLSSF